MLSRRNIRVKVMQALYSFYTTEGLSKEEVLSYYDDTIKSSYNLLYYQLYLMVKIAEHSKDDVIKRQAKLLPSEFDKAFTAKFYENPLTQTIAANKELQKIALKYQFEEKTPEDFTRKLYKTLSLTPEYAAYVSGEGSGEEDQQIMLFLFKELCKQEFYNDTIEDIFFNWLDDQSIIIGTVKKIIKDFKTSKEISEEYGPSDEAINEFGREMLKYVLVNNESLEKTLGPLIDNWDIERVAFIDMILIKMSVAEMLIFPTIPTKVSINEYVELTKAYSTDKSKDFVNGILDKALHTLSESKRSVNQEEVYWIK
ncbi:MAG: transcription antitermination factor NusB [Saprospiraceae bacterium]|nr:transcription antitermination factor NusB [Candidatus Brachybacter algidus]